MNVHIFGEHIFSSAFLLPEHPCNIAIVIFYFLSLKSHASFLIPVILSLEDADTCHVFMMKACYRERSMAEDSWTVGRKECE
jgi:hypothetical protein